MGKFLKKVKDLFRKKEPVDESKELEKNLEQIRNFLESGLKDQRQRQNFIDLFDAQIRLERLKIDKKKFKSRQWHITANILICAICVAIVTCLITKDNSNLIHYIHEYVFRGI